MKHYISLLLSLLGLTLPLSLPVGVQAPSERILVADLDNIPVSLITDAGQQQSRLKGQIVIRRFLDANRRVVLEFRALNLLIASVKTVQATGQTGQISLSLTAPLRTFAQSSPTGENFDLNVRLVGHYPLITRLRGYGRRDLRQADSFPALTEEFVGVLRGRLVLPTGNSKLNPGSLMLQGELPLGQRVQLAVVRRIGMNIVNAALREQLFPLLCPGARSSAGTRTLCVQPIYVRSGSSDSTAEQEDYFATELNTANEIWRHCCVQFQAQAARFVNRTDLQVITATTGEISAEETDLLDEVDLDECIEVYVIETFDPEDAHGGGTTTNLGMAAAKIITAANNLPLNQRHLAHELGHVLGLCHPLEGCVAPLADGTRGSLMEPSGFYADNPDVLRQGDCDNISNALIRSVPRFCCQMPNP